MTRSQNAKKRTRINLDLPDKLLAEVDKIATVMGVARQALIKMWIHESVAKERG